MNTPFWKKIPALRLLLPFAMGILLQMHYQFTDAILRPIAWICYLFVITSFLLPVFTQYRWRIVNGLLIHLLFLALGSLCTFNALTRQHQPVNLQKSARALLLELLEPPAEKPRSYKTTALVFIIDSANQVIASGEKMIVYLKKDSAAQALEPGYRLLTSQQPQLLSQAINPGGFNYAQYLARQGITRQLYLAEGDWELLSIKKKSLLYSMRQFIVGLIRDHIHGEKEKGLAEALLIGYKDDLDKDLVRSYTNTGVVHIIAISGLHLGLIYWLLVQLFRPLQKKPATRLLRFFLIVCGLWLFSLLAGAQPSILRSAFMFTCIAAGETFARKGSVYNTLALSAFALLWFNPYWLYDIGFQLSYAAVLSLLLFTNTVYHLLFIKNRWIDLLWKMNAVTLAAQILTIPLCFYHFHQFPNYFLLTNLVAVPLSSLILLGEILLCCLSPLASIAGLLGTALEFLIRLMNDYIEWIEAWPFSVWPGIQISLPQALLLTLFLAGLLLAWAEHSVSLLKLAFLSLAGFTLLRSASFIAAQQQQKLIVYRVPLHRAMDIISGRRYLCLADSTLMADRSAQHFQLAPTRTLHRVSASSSIDGFVNAGNYLLFGTKRILLLEPGKRFKPAAQPERIDLLLVSGKPAMQLPGLLKTFRIDQVVLDGTMPAYAAKKWQTDCDSMGIPCHNTSLKGAFEMSLR